MSSLKRFVKLVKNSFKRMHTKFAQTYSLKPIVRSNVLSPIIYRADNEKLVHTPKYLQKYVV